MFQQLITLVLNDPRLNCGIFYDFFDKHPMLSIFPAVEQFFQEQTQVQAGNWQANNFGFKLTDIPLLFRVNCEIRGSRINISQEGHAFSQYDVQLTLTVSNEGPRFQSPVARRSIVLHQTAPRRVRQDLEMQAFELTRTSETKSEKGRPDRVTYGQTKV